MLKILSNALTDIVGGYERRRVWIALATEDIFDQHRRTTLGPLWLLVNYFAFAATFIFIFTPGPLDPLHAIYIGVGLLVWFYINDTVTQAVSLFEREEGFIRGTTLPLSVYVMRLTLQNLIRSGYALAGCIVILLLAGVVITGAWMWSALGVLLILIASPAVVAVFAFLGVFFPDSQFIVANLMRVAMFATPVFWGNAGGDPVRTALYYWNPFTYFLAIVREPIVNGSAPLSAFGVCIIITLAMWALATLLLGTFRRQVALIV
ncbi:ABC transporter permease [Devosia insulae DS-56]|uniref:ABC transporter permease n=1 Tax=Devosia insulae DS-56 TaxID=1116389 RepID=A0A1E5XPK4_9HYPH|nr:ABC transporter permease [Devosia insulae]OEO30518.1 ABC transporter permease [Devosia insulae DS-56]